MDQYIERIASSKPQIDDPSKHLRELHYQHLVTVPFEDLSIHHNQPIDLDVNKLYQKVIVNKRGGFCYELNSLFYHLLTHLGYETTIISARIFDEEGKPGPEYDHMALLVHFDEPWLCDVGFGDLFLSPIRVQCGEVQFDGRKWFKVERNGDEYVLLESKDQKRFEKKYLFTLKPKKIPEFYEQCLWKQEHPNSYFVKNKICTIPTSDGRKTLFNTKYIVKSGGLRTQVSIQTPQQEKDILWREFGILI